ncbi:hypothetical protein TWF594_008018 [Orbilia oligospora]|nr:hypothetical protein TWF594_008018 [Orbilia oligospora]
MDLITTGLLYLRIISYIPNSGSEMTKLALEIPSSTSIGIVVDNVEIEEFLTRCKFLAEKLENSDIERHLEVLQIISRGIPAERRFCASLQNGSPPCNVSS